MNILIPGPYGLCHSDSILSPLCVSSHGQRMKKCMWLCSKKQHRPQPWDEVGCLLVFTLAAFSQFTTLSTDQGFYLKHVFKQRCSCILLGFYPKCYLFFYALGDFTFHFKITFLLGTILMCAFNYEKVYIFSCYSF